MGECELVVYALQHGGGGLKQLRAKRTDGGPGAGPLTGLQEGSAPLPKKKLNFAS